MNAINLSVPLDLKYLLSIAVTSYFWDVLAITYLWKHLWSMQLVTIHHLYWITFRTQRLRGDARTSYASTINVFSNCWKSRTSMHVISWRPIKGSFFLYYHSGMDAFRFPNQSRRQFKKYCTWQWSELRKIKQFECFYRRCSVLKLPDNRELCVRNVITEMWLK